jgi:hypothetical protein
MIHDTYSNQIAPRIYQPNPVGRDTCGRSGPLELALGDAGPRRSKGPGRGPGGCVIAYTIIEVTLPTH